MKLRICTTLGCLILIASACAKADSKPTEHYLSSDCAKRFLANDKHLVEKWIGGDVSNPPEMQLYDNGLLSIEGENFAPHNEKHYFLWSKDAGEGILKITVCDSREKNLLRMEAASIGVSVLAFDEKSKAITYAVLKVDQKTKNIFYSVHRNGISFGGWNFYKVDKFP